MGFKFRYLFFDSLKSSKIGGKRSWKYFLKQWHLNKKKYDGCVLSAPTIYSQFFFYHEKWLSLTIFNVKKLSICWDPCIFSNLQFLSDLDCTNSVLGWLFAFFPGKDLAACDRSPKHKIWSIFFVVIQDLQSFLQTVKICSFFSSNDLDWTRGNRRNREYMPTINTPGTIQAISPPSFPI